MRTSTFGLENKINRLFARVGPFLRERQRKEESENRKSEGGMN
jgi:hypothetical protein